MVYKTMHFVDHLFILLLFVVQPIYGAHSWKRYLAQVAAGQEADRVQLYRQTMILEWLAFAIVGGTWLLLGRSAADLGFVAVDSYRLWGGVLALVVLTAALAYAWSLAIRMSPAEKAEQTEKLGSLVYILPRDRRDFRSFVGISFTAGIVEEFLYRGFAFWYLFHFMPVWAAIVVSSFAFGLGHSYQGAGGVVRVTLVGVAFGLFYLLTGSIWLTMLAHVILDVMQGLSCLEVLGEDGKE